MFNETKYSKWYFTIIEKARQQNRIKYKGTYYERHHVIPKSLGGSNKKDNLVYLTAKEHYICHLLLPKMCTDSKHKGKMVYAIMQLSEAANPWRSPYTHSSRLYAFFKEKYINSISGTNSALYGISKTEEHKLKISQTRKDRGTGVGEKNPMYGKRHTEESKRKMSTEKRKNKRPLEELIKSNPRSRTITDGKNIWPSISQWAREHNCDKGVGQRKIIKGELWSVSP